MILFLGPPGTGKTTRLTEEVRRRKLAPHDLYYVAFTRRAAEEARNKATAIGGDSFVANFSTIHALAFRLLGCRRDDMLDHADYRELGKLLNITFSHWYDSEEAFTGGQGSGDRLRAVTELARARCVLPEDVRRENAEDIDPWQLRRYAETLTQYKLDTGKLDFADLLEQALGIEPLTAKLAVVDEAQDLSQLQWRVVRHLFRNVSEILVAGDDDQAIFRWAGADVETFLGLKAEREILSRSYRCPHAVHRLAQKITGEIAHRYEKPWTARHEPGAVEIAGEPGAVDLGRDGSYLLLARNGMHLARWRELLRGQGLPYILRQTPGAKPEHLRAIRAHEARRAGRTITEIDAELVTRYRTSTGPWYEAMTGIPADDAAYYRAALRRGHKLDGAGSARYRINTIHGVKGGEADHVVLLTDRAPRTDAGGNTDEEQRVWYVAVTRARQTLQVVAPQGVYSYPLLEKITSN